MNEQSIFIAALERDSAQRRAYLEEACAGNPELLSHVEQLLVSHESTANFLDQPAGKLIPTHDQPITEKPGTRIGPYRLLENIGEGGFGVVYMAEQTEPVRRKVALKIIKPGMDTKDVIARFEAERQALAMMDHPNIAKVLGAGATESGRPYFVMELINGIPLTEFCDSNNLSMHDRLALLVTVCRAVQHAHQKGVIHRDLKPSNVMISLHDGKPVPVIIDFGVSKALHQQLTDKTLFAAYGQMVGTPVYMSPEQAEMSRFDIDTRSDINSLGVLLYELLTGSTPLDAQRLRGTAYAEMQRLIRDEQSPKPSSRLSTLGDALAKIAKQRNTDPKRLGQFLRGDLDWIVMKALEKERDRRYDTVNSRAVAAGVALAATVLLGIIGTTTEMIRANRSRAGGRLQPGQPRNGRRRRGRRLADCVDHARQHNKPRACARKRPTDGRLARQAAHVREIQSFGKADRICARNKSGKFAGTWQRRGIVQPPRPRPCDGHRVSPRSGPAPAGHCRRHHCPVVEQRR